MRAHLLYFHSWVTSSNLSHNRSNNYKVFRMRKYPYGKFIYTKIYFFRKIIFLQNYFFRQIFLTNIFPINKKIFSQKKLFVNVWRFMKFFHNLKNIIVQHNFLEIKKFWKILKNYFTRKIFKKLKNDFAKNFKKLFDQKNIKKIEKKWFCKKFFKNLKNDFAQKNWRKWFAKKFFRNLKKMKNYFATKFFSKSQDVWTLSKWDWQVLFVWCVCVEIFNKYGRTSVIVLETIIVHQQEAMTQNKRTQLH